MRMRGYFQALHYYDPNTDADAVRISGFDGRGGEFFMRMPLADAGHARRKQRKDAEQAITMAIDAGLQPGEVVTD